jgi:hypothetical protein
VDFVLKIPSAKLKRQKDTFGFEGSEHRSSVQELRELLHRRKPGLIKTSLLALKAELDQSTSSSCEQHNNASRGLFDEPDRKHSENEVFGRMIRRKPKKSIIQREIEASMSHCSDSFESLDAQGLQQLCGPEILSRRGNSRRANSWEELFVDLKMETARKADFVRASSSRTIGSNDGKSWEELFTDLKMETARKADFVRAPSSRTIGSNDGIVKGNLNVKDSPPAA